MVMTIKAENLCVRYGDTLVWENINLDLNEPGLVSILGPNGVGKSTFMYTINRILDPTEGHIYLDGKDVAEMSYKDIAKRIAYVPQASGETFAMTVMDTVLMGRYPHSGFVTTREDKEIAVRSLKLMHMGEYAMRDFNELSAGQHQRVMIARGLAQMPDLLMLDEPTSNLDIYHQIYTMQLLHEIAHERGIMVLIICHDLNTASRFSDRVIMFSKGKVRADGTSKEVITPEIISEVYKVKADVQEVDGRPYVIFHAGELDIHDDPENDQYMAQTGMEPDNETEEASTAEA